MTLSTNATLRDCQQFVAAVQQAHGRTPAVLANIPLSGAALLNAQGAPSDPARFTSKSIPASTCE